MKRFAYVGCRTTKERGARGKGIEIYAMHDLTGGWKHVGTQGDLVNPSFLTLDKTGEYLYAIHGDFSEISAFRVNRETGLLSPLGQQSTEGENPVYLIPDSSNTFILVANLQTGSVVALPRNADGSLGKVRHKAMIPGIKEGDISHPHQIIYDRAEKHLFVPSQGRKAGYTKTTVFAFDPEKGFEAKSVLHTRERAEARHVAVHPGNQFVYLINEKDNTVCFHTYDACAGELTPVQIVSTIPEFYTGNGWASGIAITGDGRHVYASNRTHDSVTMYRVNPGDGTLSTIGWVSSQGKTPRFLTIDPQSRFVYVANENSDTILTFRIEDNGNLTYTGQTIDTGSPVCIIFS